MSPEQTTRGRLGPESDWYGVGALLYEVLTGSPPFGGTLLEVVEAKWLRDPMRPGKLAGVPADLDSLCMGLLQRSPQDRPTGKEVLARLGGSVTAGERDRAPRSVFIGRRAELEALASAYAKSCKGAALTVHVHGASGMRSEEHTSELQSRLHLVCRLLLEKKKKKITTQRDTK